MDTMETKALATNASNQSGNRFNGGNRFRGSDSAIKDASEVLETEDQADDKMATFFIDDDEIVIF